MSNQATDKQIQDAYAMAKERYAMLGVDTDQVLEHLVRIPVSLRCWQGDDVGGFEVPNTELGGPHFLSPEAVARIHIRPDEQHRRKGWGG